MRVKTLYMPPLCSPTYTNAVLCALPGCEDYRTPIEELLKAVFSKQVDASVRDTCDLRSALMFRLSILVHGLAS